MTESVTDLDVIIGGNPRITAPPGFYKIPVDCNKGAGSDTPYIYVCYKRGDGTPITGLTVIQGGSGDITPPAGYQKINADLNKGAGGDYIFLCFKKGSGTPLTDIVIRSTTHDSQRIPVGYTKIHVDLNDNAGGDYIYAYYQRSLHEDPPFEHGIQPAMLADIGKEYEISRAQVGLNSILIRLMKLVFTERIALGRNIPFNHQQQVVQGMKRSEMESVARTIGISASASYNFFSAKVNVSLQSTRQRTFTTSEETKITKTINLPAIDYNRWYAFVTVEEILRVIKISDGSIVSEAHSRTNNYGYFVTNRYGHWET